MAVIFIQQAQEELRQLGISFNRLLNQLEKSCIEENEKRAIIDAVQEEASIVRHLGIKVP